MTSAVMTGSSRRCAFVWLHDRSRLAEQEVRRCMRACRKKAMAIPDKLGPVLQQMDISLFYLHYPGTRQPSDQRVEEDCLRPCCIHDTFHDQRSLLWDLMPQEVLPMPSCLMALFALENAVAALSSLELREGHSLLVLDAHTGLVNQLAAHIIGPGSVNIGLTTSFFLSHCRFLTDVIRRSHPAVEKRATLPVFKVSKVEKLPHRVYDRILVIDDCADEVKRLCSESLLAADGVMVSSRIDRNRRLMVVHRRLADGTISVEDAGRLVLLNNFDGVTEQLESRREPESLTRLAMERAALTKDPLRHWRDPKDESILRGFYFCSCEDAAAVTASAFTKLQEEWLIVSSPRLLKPNAEPKADNSLMRVVQQCARLAAPLTMQVSRTAAKVIRGTVRFLEEAVAANEEPVKDSALFKHQLVNMPIALDAWISSMKEEHAAVPLEKKLEEVLVDNAARVVSDVEAIRRLITSAVAPRVLRDSDKFSRWAVDFNRLVLHHAKESSKLVVERVIHPFHLLYSSRCFSENPTNTVVGVVGSCEDSTSPILRAHTLSTFDRKMLNEIEGNIMEPSPDTVGFIIGLKALIQSVNIRCQIRLDDNELFRLTHATVEKPLQKEIERLNKTIPDVTSLNAVSFYNFTASRVYEDSVELIEYLRYYCAEMQYCALAGNPEAFYRAALPSRPPNFRNFVIDSIDIEEIPPHHYTRENPVRRRRNEFVD